MALDLTVIYTVHLAKWEIGHCFDCFHEALPAEGRNRYYSMLSLPTESILELSLKPTFSVREPKLQRGPVLINRNIKMRKTHATTIKTSSTIYHSVDA